MALYARDHTDRGAKRRGGTEGAPVRQIDLLVTHVGPPGGMSGCRLAAGRALRPGSRCCVGNGHLEPAMQVLTKPFAMAPAGRIQDVIVET
jgi:hypothetical protein